MKNALLIAGLAITSMTTLGMQSNYADINFGDGCRKRTFSSTQEKNSKNSNEIDSILNEKQSFDEKYLLQKVKRAKKSAQLIKKIAQRQIDQWFQKIQTAEQKVKEVENQLQQFYLATQSLCENDSNENKLNTAIPRQIKFGKKAIFYNQSKYLEVVNKAFGVNFNCAHECSSLIKEAFKAFESRRARWQETGTNLLFWNGNAYLNGSIPISYTYDNLWVQGRKYHPIQLCEIFGYTTAQMNAIADIYEIFPKLTEAFSYFPIQKFWNEAKFQKNSEIGQTVLRYKEKHKPWSHKYLELAANYIMSSRNLQINTIHMDFKQEDLLISYRKAEKTNKDFLIKFGEYIGTFNKEDKDSFINQLQNIKNSLKEAPDLCNMYKRYAHTEYMVKYLQKQNGNEAEPLYMVSYYDICQNCEKLLAETTKEENEKNNTIVISVHNYIDSRYRDRPKDLVNKSFLQIQLP